MEDDLNMDPRETDYADDMKQEINFYELKMQLADLGFYDSGLVNSLRDQVIAGEPLFQIDCREYESGNELRTWFEYDQYPGGDYRLQQFQTLFSIDGEDVFRLFQPDITRAEALAVLYHDRQNGQDPRAMHAPLNRATINYLLKNNTMNTENLNYLQKQLLNLGFGDKLNDELAKNIKNKVKEFTLSTNQEYNKSSVDYTLHYKAGDKDDMYFFNKYDAKTNDQQHTFYLNSGQGVTAKEAFNLLEGRAVYKHLENKAGETYNAWITLDKTNDKLQSYTDGWNYKPDKGIDKMDIVGIGEPGAREKLMKSIEKGNRHQVSAMKNGKEVQLYIEANPAEHRLNLTNYKGEPQKLEDYKKPEVKTEQKQENKPDDTKKKRSRGNKIAA